MDTGITESYGLSPLQQGMLFHHLSESEPGVDIEQIVCTLREDVQVDAFRDAWQRFAARHSACRTAFRWDGGEVLQEVHASAVMPIEELDWRERDVGARDRDFSAFLMRDRERAFDLTRAPVMRVTLLRLDHREWRCVWTLPHLLMDGRSFPVALGEVFALYEAIRDGRALLLPTPGEYREFIEWLARRDTSADEPFWRGLLRGFAAPTVLAFAPSTDSQGRGERDASLSIETTLALRAIADRHNLTLNTIVQGAWAILLARHAGDADVVFGVTRAGRHGTVPRADSTLGVFINTLPVRARLDGDRSVVEWLGELRAQGIALRAHEHTPLDDVRRWSDVTNGSALFESIVVYDHELLSSTMRSRGGAWAARDARLVERTSFPITLYAYGEDAIALTLAYDRPRFSDRAMARALDHLVTILEGIASDPRRLLCDVPFISSEEREMVTLSAKSPASLAAATEPLAQHLASPPDANLADVANGPHVGRTAFAHRRMVVAREAHDASTAFADDASREAARVSFAGLRKRADVADWFYVPIWKQTMGPGAGASDTPGRWLLFADECGVGERLARRLEREGHTVYVVRAGDRFDRDGGSTFTVRPRVAEDYDELFAALRAHGGVPDRIAHMWAVTASEPLPTVLAAYEATQATTFHALLCLVQALGKEDLATPCRLAIISNGMQQVAGELLRYPEKATLLGPCRVIGQEFPGIACRSLDVGIPEWGAHQPEALLDQLVAELRSDATEPVVAYRGHRRFVQDFEPARLGRPNANATRLRAGGVYLITGGLGGIGVLVAEHLAREAKAKLVLVARTPLPPREEWGAWLARDDADDATTLRIRKVQALEALGADVLVLAADVADLDSMTAALRRARERFGSIHGVIHAAGVLDDGVILLKDPATADRVLSPKVRGALVLDAALRNTALDFFVLFSSVSAIAGPVGQVDYAAANAFLDAFAHQRTARDGGFTVAVNWSAWQEVGIAAKLARRLGIESDGSIAPAEGVEALRRILDGAPLPQVIVSSQDLHALIAILQAPVAGANASQEGAAGSAVGQPRPNLATMVARSRDAYRMTLAEAGNAASV